ncbi:hypothetical protein [Amycolatopsis sp. MtRt-6]|uniref:hypothetical protein n=1 Tax=Amycolatopsis sp. MtRt-6 TaxID=2792782 RepID=UPI001F5D95DA|nr:hypothetical protein [Amycolatopsis sp. MtRt-6]
MNKFWGARSLARGFAALTAAAVLTSVFAGPAAAERAQLEGSISGLKSEYASNEDVHFTVKLTNTGSVTAEGVYVFPLADRSTDLDVPYGAWGDLNAGRGIKLEPGQSVEQPVTGSIRDVRQGTLTVRVRAFDKTGSSVSPDFEGSAKVVPAPGVASGVVYGDKNGNGVRDSGEELAGLKLTLRYVHGYDVTYTTTSDDKGNFTFKVPAADYRLGGDVVDGWLFPWRFVHIGDDAKLDLRGVPPLNGALAASMAFTQESYQAGDLAHLTVTLSNSGPIPLTGIVAACDRYGSDFGLKGNGPGWGDLGNTAAGVTIAPRPDADLRRHGARA